MADANVPEAQTAALTQLLAAARNGDANAANAAFAALYGHLHRVARSRIREHQAMTLLDTTALLHESYLKLVGTGTPPVVDRRHFFAYASRVMRSVIVDYARARNAERRGGGADHVTLDTMLSDQVAAPENDVLRVHEALDVLAQADARLAQVVEMRYFGGLTESEIADALGVTDRTVRRDWEKARLLLLAAMT